MRDFNVEGKTDSEILSYCKEKYKDIPDGVYQLYGGALGGKDLYIEFEAASLRWIRDNYPDNDSNWIKHKKILR